MAKNFRIGELVWAKMRKYPFWPGEIAKPPPNSKLPSLKKPQHYVFFFGSDNCAWIPDENIVPHSEEMLLSCSKIKSTQFQKAVEKIRIEGIIVQKKGKKKESDSEEESDAKLSEESQSCTTSKQKVDKKQGSKIKYETAKKQYFKNIHKKAQNQYRAKVHKKVRKQYAADKCKSKNKSAEDQPQNTEPGTSSGFHCVAVNRLLEEFTYPSIETKNVEATNKKIGFIGLGTMGQRIVKNLIDTGHDITIWNRTSDKCEEFVKSGAKQALTPADLVAECDITFSCLSGTEAVRSVFFEVDGIISGVEKSQGSTKSYVELSTVDIATAEELGNAIKHRGGRFLDAPIFGSKQYATSGSLLVLASGDLELFKDCESCFYAMSNNAYYMSTEFGIGSKMNVLLNVFVGTTYSALAEAMALVERCGLSTNTFLEFLDHCPLSCPLFEQKGEAIISQDFSTNTELKYQQRNLNAALSISNAYDQPLLLTAAANERFKHAKRLASVDSDLSAVYLGAK